MQWLVRPAIVLCIATTAAAFQTQLQQTPQQPSVFRSATNLVTVDAYPRLNGRIVEGLTSRDFDVLEDGVPQKIDQFEFIRVEPVPEALRVDPNTQREMLQLAADPHNRVVVTYLDVYHTTFVGSHDIRTPIVDLLDHIVGVNDLFGVTTSKLPARSLVLGRKHLAFDAQLTQIWPWGQRQEVTRDSPEENALDQCYKYNPKTKTLRIGTDDGEQRLLPDILIDRRREEQTLRNLRDLIGYVGSMREARTILVIVTDGWRLFRPDQALLDATVAEQSDPRDGWMPAAPPPPPVVLTPGARVGVNTGLNDSYSRAACATELARLTGIDDARLLREIIDLANRLNVVVYPVSAGGLGVFDSGLARLPGKQADRRWLSARIDAAMTIAENTDGIAVVDTNNPRAGLSRVVNDLSAYYLLGYYSTNAKADGKYRQINVHVTRPNVAVAARRGYVATTPADARAAGPVAPNAGGSIDVTEALATLARATSRADLFTYGVVSGSDLLVVAEIAQGRVETGEWSGGGTVRVVATGPQGDGVGPASGKIEPGARAAIVRVPLGRITGPWRVGVTVTGVGGTLLERFDVRPPDAERLIATPILYRGTGSGRSALQPVADDIFHRTERLRAEFVELATVDSRTARVLNQRGSPLPLDVTLTERDDSGRRLLAADLNLAPLGPGDYVLEVTAAARPESERRLVAFRVVR